MSRAWRRQAAAIATLLLASACGPQPDGQVRQREGDLAPEASAVFDLCARPAGALRQLCAGEAMAETAGELASTLASEAAQLSTDGARRLAQDQAAWAVAEFAVCEASVGPQQSLPQCLARALAERLRDADQAAQQMGGYTFQRAEAHASYPIPAARMLEMGLAEDAPRAVAHHLSWPRIDSPQTPATQRFNEAARRAAPPENDLMDAAVDYTIAYAGPTLISVRFETYSYAPGAAHPNGGAEALNLLMDAGRPLEPGDVFTPDSGWEEFLVAQASKGLADVFAEFGEPPRDAQLRDAVVKPRLWVISEEGLTLLFPPYALGGPYALGAQQVHIRWSQLEPYLRPDAPAPFRLS